MRRTIAQRLLDLARNSRHSLGSTTTTLVAGVQPPSSLAGTSGAALPAMVRGFSSMRSCFHDAGLASVARLASQLPRASGLPQPKSGLKSQLSPILFGRRQYSNKPPMPPESLEDKQAKFSRNLVVGTAGTCLLLAGLVFGGKALSSLGMGRGGSDDDVDDDGSLHSRRMRRQAAGSWSDSLELQFGFMVQQWLTASSIVKIMTLLLAAFPVTAALGTVYSLALGRSPFVGFGKIYALLLRMPGPIMIEEPNMVSAMVASTTFTLSVFGFAVVLGIVGDDVRSRLVAFREGNLPIIQRGHILILNANSHMVPLVHQITMAKKKKHGDDSLFDRPVVILSELPKLQVDADLAEELGPEDASSIMVRRGSPFLLQDLDRVSARNAHTVIILHPDSVDPQDAVHRKLATMVALQAMRQQDADAAESSAKKKGNTGRAGRTPRVLNVVVQTPRDDAAAKEEVRALNMISGASEDRGMHVVHFCGTSNVFRIMAQAAVQPGLSDVYGHIAEPSEDSVRFSIEHFPELGGMRYGDARRLFQTCVPIGVVTPDHVPHLNPPDSMELGEEDRILALARGGEFVLSDTAAMDFSVNKLQLINQLKGAKQRKAQSKHIVVVGWEGDASHLAHGLAEFSPPGTSVSFLGPNRPSGLPSKAGNCSFKYIPGPTNSDKAYQAAGLASADAMIIGNGTRQASNDMQASDMQADAQVLSVLTSVQNYLCGGGVPLHKIAHVVTMLNNIDTAHTASYITKTLGRDCITCEVLYPRELVGGLLSQVAMEPDLAAPIREMIETEEGMEIYMRSPERYNVGTDQPTPFAAVAELVRMRNETAVGYVTARGEVQLSPHAQSEHQYSEGSRIITIAEE